MGDPRRRRLAAVLAALATAATFAGFRGFEAWRYRAEIGRARGEIDRGDHASAAPRLAALARRWPGDGEVEYALGTSERALGRPDAALSAWSRVPAGSPLAAEAALARGRLAMELGRFAEAERALTAGLAGPGAGGRVVEIRGYLIHLLGQEGRYDEALGLVRDQWLALAAARPAEALHWLRTHLAIDLEPEALGAVRPILDRASALAPDDARVRLARANLAVREGRLDDAQSELVARREARPGDRSDALARLRWALAAHRADEAERTTEVLGVDGLTATELAAMRAWRAARRGDRGAERLAWDGLLSLDPAEPAVLERLATLAIAEGDVSLASESRRRKAGVDDAMHRYRTLVRKGTLADDARELARLAASLGRRFEARAFSTMALRRWPADREARRDLSARPGGHGIADNPPARPLALVNLVLDDIVAAESGSGGPADVAGRSPGAVPRFADDAGSSGLSFAFESGETPLHQLPETMAGGIGLLDADGDGSLDVFAVQGGRFPPDPDVPGRGDRLFRNRGDGTFEDVTERAGIGTPTPGYGHGVAVGDFDNDGRPDLFVTRWRRYSLYRNKGDGTFEDVTERMQLSGDRDWPTSAAWADLDDDGDLDLYVCHYLAWDSARPRLCRSPVKDGYMTCDPKAFESMPDHVFRNDGDRFTDVSAEAGMTGREGRGLGVVAADLDGDGRTDLFVANDGSANFLWRNLGGFRFEEVAHTSGVAGNAAGGYQAGMGVACGDLDGDGLIDLAVTNFFGESTTFYKNLGRGLFVDRTAAVGLAVPSRPKLGFGIGLLDADNDGRLDLLSANGHVNDFRPRTPYAMPAQLLRGGPGGRLTDISDRAGDPFLGDHLGRGLATGDLDNDGKPDALLVALDEPLVFLHNRTEAPGHSLTLALEGTKSNRDAVGAIVTVKAGGRRQVAMRLGGGSYLSASDPRMHFGLGRAPRADSVEVRWPSGSSDIYSQLDGDRGFLLREGDREPKPLFGGAVRDEGRGRARLSP